MNHDHHPELSDILSRRPELESALTKLEAIGLSGTISKYLEGANEKTWDVFLSEIQKLDFEHLNRHRNALFDRSTQTFTADDLEPVKADADQADHADADAERGLASLDAGEWAIVVFAGGAGTRFSKGWDRIAEAVVNPSERMRKKAPDQAAPKGVFPITPVQGLSFYEKFVAEALAVGIETGTMPLLLFMTSRVTHDQTVKWFDDRWLWGLPEDTVQFFRQGEIPRLDADGDLIVKPDGSLFWTGNGHGGVYDALVRDQENSARMADILKASGVKYVILGNVDNAALAPLMPRRLGYHLRKGSAFTLSTVKRTNPDEKVGMACRIKETGKIEVIEYSVLDPELSAASDGKGGLLFDAAHINSNLLSLDAIRTDLPGTLYTNKSVKVGDRTVASSTYEMLNQHLSGVLDGGTVYIYEDERDEIFLPTKNLIGEDSVQTTTAALADKAFRIILDLGGTVARGALTEFHPCLGMSASEIGSRGVGEGWRLGENSRLYLAARHGVNKEKDTYGSHLSLGRDATFIIRSDHPYGTISYDRETRMIAEDRHTAGRFTLGERVTIANGTRFVADIQGDGRLIISDGTVIRKGLDIVVKSGELLVIY